MALPTASATDFGQEWLFREPRFLQFAAAMEPGGLQDVFDKRFRRKPPSSAQRCRPECLQYFATAAFPAGRSGCAPSDHAFLISLISQWRAQGRAIGHRGVRICLPATPLNVSLGQGTIHCSNVALAISHGSRFTAGTLPTEGETTPFALRKRYAPVSIHPSTRRYCLLDGQKTTTFPGAS